MVVANSTFIYVIHTEWRYWYVTSSVRRSIDSSVLSRSDDSETNQIVLNQEKKNL